MTFPLFCYLLFALGLAAELYAVSHYTSIPPKELTVRDALWLGLNWWTTFTAYPAWVRRWLNLGLSGPRMFL